MHTHVMNQACDTHTIKNDTCLHTNECVMSKQPMEKKTI